jgi:hypothetical protein
VWAFSYEIVCQVNLITGSRSPLLSSAKLKKIVPLNTSVTFLTLRPLRLASNLTLLEATQNDIPISFFPRNFCTVGKSEKLKYLS